MAHKRSSSRSTATLPPEGWVAYLGAIGAWLTISLGLEATAEPSTATVILLQAGLFAAFGGIALWFARSSGALHCRISAPAYLALAVLAVPTAAGAVPLTPPALMALWLLIFVGAYGAEHLVRGRGGGSDANA